MAQCYRCKKQIEGYDDLKTVYFGSDPIACCKACEDEMKEELKNPKPTNTIIMRSIHDIQ